MDLFNNIAEVSLSYKSNVKSSDRAQISNSSDAHNAFYNTWDLDCIEHVEEFKVLLLNRAHRVLGLCKISQGGLTGTVIDTRVILQYALKSNASSLILCHNHPSGNTKPSEADIAVTKKIREAAQLMDINVLDHVIVTPEGCYFSLADNGLI